MFMSCTPTSTDNDNDNSSEPARHGPATNTDSSVSEMVLRDYYEYESCDAFASARGHEHKRDQAHGPGALTAPSCHPGSVTPRACAANTVSSDALRHYDEATSGSQAHAHEHLVDACGALAVRVCRPGSVGPCATRTVPVSVSVSVSVSDDEDGTQHFYEFAAPTHGHMHFFDEPQAQTVDVEGAVEGGATARACGCRSDAAGGLLSSFEEACDEESDEEFDDISLLSSDEGEEDGIGSASSGASDASEVSHINFATPTPSHGIDDDDDDDDDNVRTAPCPSARPRPPRPALRPPAIPPPLAPVPYVTAFYFRLGEKHAGDGELTPRGAMTRGQRAEVDTLVRAAYELDEYRRRVVEMWRVYEGRGGR